MGMSFARQGEDLKKHQVKVIQAEISGRVFVDYNRNAIFDGDDYGIEGVPILLTVAEDVAPTFTDENGYFKLVARTDTCYTLIAPEQYEEYTLISETDGVVDGESIVSTPFDSREKNFGYQIGDVD